MVRKDYIPENCGQSGPKGGWRLAGAEGKSAVEGHDFGETMEDLQPIVEKSPFWGHVRERKCWSRGSARMAAPQQEASGPGWPVGGGEGGDAGQQAADSAPGEQAPGKGGRPGPGGRGEGVNASLVLEWRGPRSGWAGLGKVKPSRKVKGKVLSSKGTSP